MFVTSENQFDIIERFTEVSPSGRWQRFAKPRPEQGHVGSNPTTSAGKPAGCWASKALK